MSSSVVPCGLLLLPIVVEKVVVSGVFMVLLVVEVGKVFAFVADKGDPLPWPSNPGRFPGQGPPHLLLLPLGGLLLGAAANLRALNGLN